MGTEPAAMDQLSISMVDDSDFIAANGPPQSVNMSEYSMLRNLIDKALKSPRHQSSDDAIDAMTQEVAQLHN